MQDRERERERCTSNELSQGLDSAPQFQPIDSKKRKEKRTEVYSRNTAAQATKIIGPAPETRQSHTIECEFSKIVPEGD